jgi:NodT family efflux transporter outer membrane factor (OMF) lipoprotein
MAGCAVGPDYVRPETPDVSSYDFAPLPDATADGAQKILQGQDIPGQWWELFRSESLNKLIDQAIKDNPDLASADAALRVAEDNLSAGSGAFFPTATGSFASTRQKTSTGSGLGGGTYYTLHNASVAVSYNPDLWGGTRRTVEQLQARVGLAGFQKEAAFLALTSNVATAAFTEASLREQIAAAKDVIAAQQKTLELAKTRFAAGAVSKSAVVLQESALASVKASLPPLQHQLVVTRHALSALLGQMPSKEPAAKFNLNDLKLPHEIPLSLPSKLVEQRPDVRAAEENLHAASAAIGVAVAARLPNVTLSADLGTMAGVLNKLFTSGFGFWSLGASAAGTLLDAGTLADKEQAARDAFDEAGAQYRKTVLAAFQEVADALHALQSDAESLNVKSEAEKAAVANLTLVRAQFDAGAVSAAETLQAQITERQARAAVAQARAQRFADTAALFAALGGGWWNRVATQPEKVSHD